MNKDEFIKIFGGMYEHSPWAAEQAWHAGITIDKSVIGIMKTVVDNANENEKLNLILAHPDLAGKLALSGALTQSSKSEQAGAGLDQCSPNELEKFQRYNYTYKEKFDFPFIIAVKGLNRNDILENFEQRLNNSVDAERITALTQIHKIARLRIQTYLAQTEKHKMTKPDFTSLTNLAATRLGTKVVFSTDDFFADKTRLISAKDPVFIPDKYDDNGKWMDGWESRRKRITGHDFAIIKLGRSGQISGFEIDTAHFTGNFPPFFSIELANSDLEIPNDNDWSEHITKTDLCGDSQHYFEMESNEIWTHIRLHIYPDGGVARLRVYGQIFMDWDKFDVSQELDLAALEFGGRAIYCNDAHFGQPENMIAPTKGINMGDGWETRRRRDPGNDWAILALAHCGNVDRILIDTAFFKGNYPDRASIQAANIQDSDDASIINASENWQELLPPQKLEMDREAVFTNEINNIGPITHIRLNIFPDGGISRLRLYGKIAN